MKSYLKKLLLFGSLPFFSVGFFPQVEAKATEVPEGSFQTVFIKKGCENVGFVTSCPEATCSDGALCPITFDWTPMMTGQEMAFVVEIDSIAHGKLKAKISPNMQTMSMADVLGSPDLRHDSGEGQVDVEKATRDWNCGINHVESNCFYHHENGMPTDYERSIYAFFCNYGQE